MLRGIDDFEPSIRFYIFALLGLNHFSAVLYFRIASALFDKGFHTLARLVRRWNWVCNGCEFSIASKIGPGLCLPHPTGIVIGGNIGSNLTVLQNVTFGFKDPSLPNQDPNDPNNINADLKRLPHLGDNVLVGAGAVLLGNVTIGDGAVIGANAVIVKDVPAGCCAVGNPARILPPKQVKKSTKTV